MIIPAKRFVIVAVLAALAATACADTFEAGAAVVNGTRISKEKLAERVKLLSPQQPEGTDQTRREALQQLIREELVRQEVIDRGIAITEADVDQLLEQDRARFPTEEEFQQALTGAGLTLEELKRAYREQILPSQKLTEALDGPITDAQLRALYRQQREQFEEVRLRHILIRVNDAANAQQVAQGKRRAEAALARVRAGESFAAVAEELSEDPSSKVNGGDLGFASLERYVPEFAQAAAQAKIGVPTEPVQTQFGWHVLLLVARRTTPFAQVKQQLLQQLRGRQIENVLGRFLDDEFKTARIAVNPLYGDWDPETAAVVEHRSFIPASPEPDPNQPPGGFGFVPEG